MNDVKKVSELKIALNNNGIGGSLGLFWEALGPPLDDGAGLWLTQCFTPARYHIMKQVRENAKHSG